MSDVLICADARSPALRHELGIAVSERVVYAETGSARYVVASPFARPALAQTAGPHCACLRVLRLCARALTRRHARQVVRCGRSERLPRTRHLVGCRTTRLSARGRRRASRKRNGANHRPRRVRRTPPDQDRGSIGRHTTRADGGRDRLGSYPQRDPELLLNDERGTPRARLVDLRRARVRTESQVDDCLRRTLGPAP